MISLIFLILAAICNAIMDTLEYHFEESKFENSEIVGIYYYWWNPTLSWKNKYINYSKDEILGIKPRLKKWLIFDKPFTDAWHTFKSLMIIFIVLSIIFNLFFSNIIFIFISQYIIYKWITAIIVIGIYGTCWNLMFNLFYNKILR